MSDKLPWFPFYIDKWETDPCVRAMGPVARSYYLILLMVQWREGHIPDSRKTLQRLLTLPSDPLIAVLSIPPGDYPESDKDLLDYDAILDQVLECFEPDGGGGLVNQRLKTIRDEQLRIAEAKSRGGKQSSKSLNGHLQDSSKTAGGNKEVDIDLNKKRGKDKKPPLSPDWTDERDSRELAKAKRVVTSRLQAAVGSGQSVTEQEFMTAVCEESGLLPARVKELESKAKWVATA